MYIQLYYYSTAADNRSYRIIIMYLTITATSNELTLVAGKSQGKGTQYTTVELFIIN